MKNKQLHISALACVAVILSACVRTNEGIKPNVIIIYTDQQSYNTIHSLSNEHIKTPNLDLLVEDGVAFTNSFVTAPACVPSRSSFHSGMYVSSHKSYTNHHWGGRPETTLPLELKRNGYTTTLIGKNHCYLDTTDIDRFIHTPAFQARPADKRTAVKAMSWELENDPMHILTDSAIQVIENRKQGQFIWLSYLYPHTPYMVPEPFFSMYDSLNIPGPVNEEEGLKAANKPFRQQFHQKNNDLTLAYDHEKTMRMKRNYYGMVSLIDAEIGRLITCLKEEGLYDNTILIFTADHGDYIGDHGLFTKSPAMYDCLVRVPLIIHYPEKIKRKDLSSELISSIDLMPTILSLLGLEIPAQVEGISYADYLVNGSQENIRTHVIAEYGLPGNNISSFDELQDLVPGFPETTFQFTKGLPWEGNPVSLAGRIRMIRTKKWKLVYDDELNSELYDMKNDPDELVNLFSDPDHTQIKDDLLMSLNAEIDRFGLDKNDHQDISSENIEKYKEFISKGKSIRRMY
jgi:arylsulfatase A-like enzyme